MDAVLDDVDRRASRLALRTTRRLCSLWVASDDPDDGSILEEVSRSIEDAMIEAHRRATRLYGVEVFASAKTVRRVLGKATKTEKDALRELYGSIARSATKKTMSRVREVLLANIVAGEPKSKRRASVKKALSAAGVGKAAGHLVNTLTKTQTALAFNSAAWETASSRDDIWGFEYVTKRDERVRFDHRLLDRARYPKTHRFWDVYAPPNGWNCRCTLRPIKKRRGLRLRAPRRRPQIDSAFRLNPGRLSGILNT